MNYNSPGAQILKKKDAAERHSAPRSAGNRSVLSMAKVAAAKARQDSPAG